MILIVFILISILLIVLAERFSVTVGGKFPIELRNSNIHGRGIFATRDIKCTEVIEYVPVVPFNRDDVRPDTILLDYDIGHPDGKQATMMFGYGALYNHRNNHNANWKFIDDKTMVITANRNINKDEEIFVNYGANYWKSRGIEPI